MNFVRDNTHLLNDEQLAAALSRLTGRLVSASAVRHARRTLDIQKTPGNGVCRVKRTTPKPPDAG